MEPIFIPWTFETHPQGFVWVRQKGPVGEHLVSSWGSRRVFLGLAESVDYETLFHTYEQLDGSPCGEQLEKHGPLGEFNTVDLVAELERRKVIKK